MLIIASLSRCLWPRPSSQTHITGTVGINFRGWKFSRLPSQPRKITKISTLRKLPAIRYYTGYIARSTLSFPPYYLLLIKVNYFFLDFRNGHLPLAKYLIEDLKCSPTCTSTYGETPLHLACGYVDGTTDDLLFTLM